MVIEISWYSSFSEDCHLDARKGRKSQITEANQDTKTWQDYVIPSTVCCEPLL
jgi:hypothetical protein